MRSGQTASESGRSRPGSQVVLRLAAALELPVRERNALLEAAGLAPIYPETPLDSELLAPFRRVIDLILRGHEPYPALVFDSRWTFVDANETAYRLFPALRETGTRDLLAMLCQPGPVRDAIENWPEVAWHALDRIRHEAATTGYPEPLVALARQVEAWLRGVDRPAQTDQADSLLVCPTFRFGDSLVRTVTTVTTFGSARDVTLQELRIEQVFPADPEADAFFRRFAERAEGGP